jgi:hypothetical protein
VGTWASRARRTSRTTGRTGATGATGSQGLKGDKGDEGPAGVPGPQGPVGVFTVENMSGYVPAPAYDSGWVHTTEEGNYSFVHNLGTVDVIVDTRCNVTDNIYSLGLGIMDHGTRFRWFNLTENEIWVNTWYNDYIWVNSTHLEGVYTPLDIRIMLWKIASP